MIPYPEIVNNKPYTNPFILFFELSRLKKGKLKNNLLHLKVEKISSFLKTKQDNKKIKNSIESIKIFVNSYRKQKCNNIYNYDLNY